MHHIGPDGKREPLLCSLPAGHEGDHESKYIQMQPTRNFDGAGRFTTTTYEPVTAVGHWNDAAGTEPGKEADAAPQMTMLQKELIADWLVKNPGKSVKEAIVDLAMKGQWR